ncbi:DUF2752 domain-containing protein [Endomicrobium proavitum]|uniref:DUF2752 domain-containing protein n=1 Tax=Endomicrobium proavitum TaxID=1408281 RepID=A0A0G3WH08_9BACT|nr:DUF2752 domain-containing protein [Endomicrobium proavitum]AKL97608.1 hypothetical protein Epro_0229 [Endomicrobium proavitum]
MLFQNKFLKKYFGKINKVRLLIVAGCALLFYALPEKFILHDAPVLCIYRLLFDKECIGCGTTRAVYQVLHFKFERAFEFNSLIIVTFPLIVICTIAWIFQKRRRLKK